MSSLVVFQKPVPETRDNWHGKKGSWWPDFGGNFHFQRKFYKLGLSDHFLWLNDNFLGNLFIHWIISRPNVQSFVTLFSGWQVQPNRYMRLNANYPNFKLKITTKKHVAKLPVFVFLSFLSFFTSGRGWWRGWRQGCLPNVGERRRHFLNSGVTAVVDISPIWKKINKSAQQFGEK